MAEDQGKREALASKWKDKPLEEVLNAKVESDLYIESLTARFDDLKKDYLELREKQQASDDLTTLIDQIKKERQNPGTTQKPRETEPTAIKPEDLDILVQKQVDARLSERQKAIKQEENFNLMQAKLKEKLGEDYQASYKQRLDQLGLSTEFADDLAKNHPSVFMKTLELDAVPNQTPFQAPPRSNQRATTFAPVAQKRDWNYYQDLKKTNPKLYLDPKIAIQMHDDAIALGDSFGLPQE